MNKQYPRLFAFLMTLCFFCFVGLYVREFPCISNSIGGGWLALAAAAVGLVASMGVLWFLRARFVPLERHLADVAFIVLIFVFFAPLFGSWLNRGLGRHTFQSFEFVAETPYFASGYGVLQGEKLTPTGYHLVVRENGKLRKFSYKTQSYYPITKPQESIILPVCNGIFGARVVLLQ
jgi:hypothetical protein